MPKGPKLTERDIEIIEVIYNRNRSAKAEAIRQLVSERCGRELGLSTIQRELARLRSDKSRGSTDPIDDQWSLASLNNYPIDSRDIAFLLYIQYTFDSNVPDEVKKFTQEKGYHLPFLTNRKAIWISRLIRLVHTDPRAMKTDITVSPPNTSDKNPGKWPEWVDDLVHIAMWYSNYEIGCELAGIKPINTINFDAPTLEQIWRNILMYNKEILKNKGIITGNEPNTQEILKSMDAEDIVPKGGRRNARSYNKKK